MKKTFKRTGNTEFDAALQKMDNQMGLIGNAFATRKNYIRGVRSLILHYQRLPENCTTNELKAFLIFQRDKRQFSSSTVN